jgi:hypothetical protein
MYVLIASTPDMKAGSATTIAMITAPARPPRIVADKATFAISVTPALETKKDVTLVAPEYHPGPMPSKSRVPDMY